MYEPTRELLWGVDEGTVTLHYLIFIIAGIIFLLGLYRWYKIIVTGRKDESRLDGLGGRLLVAVKDGILLIRLFAREAKMGGDARLSAVGTHNFDDRHCCAHYS